MNADIMNYRTKKDWKKKRRQVKVGESPAGRLNNGTSLFSKDQTEKIIKIHRKRTQSDYSTDNVQDWDEDYENGAYTGLPGQW